MKYVQNEKGLLIIVVKSEHGREFENENFQELHENFRIKHNFSNLRTPRQNCIVKRKNCTLQGWPE